jgi:hypothetical protein
MTTDDGKRLQLWDATKAVLDLAGELRKGMVDRVPGMSDLEPGLQAFLGTTLSGRREPRPQHCVQYANVRFRMDGPSAPR